MGYTSKILRVDLSRGAVEVEEVPEATVRRFIGGSGMAAKYLWEETASDTQPLEPDNLLFMGVGPITSHVPLGSRYSVAAISPATTGWGEAHSGGKFPEELKWTGYDGIAVKGKASHPVYLYIHNDQVEIRDARHLWGTDAYEVSPLIQRETDSKACVATIGRAGERGVAIAAVMNDGELGRAAGRCGIGAVMGSKNLKAVAVRGTTKPPVANPTALKEASIEHVRRFTKIRMERDPEINWGRKAGDLESIGNMAVKNFGQGTFPGFVPNMIAGLPPLRYFHCNSCSAGCLESTMGDRGRGIVGEAVIPLGSLCLLGDAQALEESWQLCQRYGMDCISVGACVSFAMEIYEKGLITKKDTGGLDLTWGNGAAMVTLIRQMGEAEGFGRLLGQGTKKAAEDIGSGAIEYAMQVKGLELAMHEPRVHPSLYWAYATTNQGAIHVPTGSHQYERALALDAHWGSPDGTDLGFPPGSWTRFGFENKARLVVQTQNRGSMEDALAICHFLTFYRTPPSAYASWLSAVAGWDVTMAEFLQTGERMFNLKRMINLRRGFTKADDTLPKRFWERRPDVAFEKETVPTTTLEEMLQEYYRLRGWTEEGVPTREKLDELGLIDGR